MSVDPFTSGPNAPERNPPINPDYFQPRKFDISAISLGQTTTITASENVDYVVGQEVRLLIPEGYGSRQLNNKTGFVISLPASNQVTLNIDSSINVNAFIASPLNDQSPAQIVAIGDVNTGQINAQGRRNNTTYIPGSFINISPN